MNRSASASPGRRRRAPLVIAAGAALVVVAGGVVVLRGHGSTAPAAASATNLQTAKVTRQDLAVYTTYSGTLGYGSPTTVVEHGGDAPVTSTSAATSATGSTTARSSSSSTSAGSAAGAIGSSPGGGSSGTVTALSAPGALVQRGDVIYRVDGRPRVLLYGSVPAWRTMSEADTTAGDDVRQLQENLIALGYDPNHRITVDGSFGASTLAAVDAWQGALGITVTGTVPLGTAVFLPGPSRVGNDKVALGTPVSTGAAITELTPTKALTTVLAPASGTVASVPAPGTALTAGGTLATVDGRAITVAFDANATAPTVSGDGFTVTVPPGTTVADQLGTADGEPVTANHPLVALGVTQRQITTNINVADRAKVKQGDTVQVTLPDGTTRDGEVAAIGAVAQQAANARSQPTVAVTVSTGDQGLDPGLVSTPVTVGFADQSAKGVLTVPVTALVALKEGGYAVQLADGKPDHLVAVKTGLYANSSVEVSGQGITEGASVYVAS